MMMEQQQEHLSQYSQIAQQQPQQQHELHNYLLPSAATAAAGNAAAPPPNPPPQVLESAHLDYITGLSMDTYGRRMASCSGDRTVKVWDLVRCVKKKNTDGEITNDGKSSSENPKDSEWVLSASWKAHRGAITSVSWAHPEFGTLLATAGHDQEVKIWEERSSIMAQPFMTGNNSSNITSSGGGDSTHGGTTATTASSNVHLRWALRVSLTEARRAVTTVEFAPRHWGCKLATGSSDGAVRIYEAVDIMNLSQWPLAAAIQVYDGNGADSGSISGSSSSSNISSGISQHQSLTLSWCTGRFEPPAFVVGGGYSLSPLVVSCNTSTTVSSSSSSSSIPCLVVYRYSEAARAWQPLLCLGGEAIQSTTSRALETGKTVTSSFVPPPSLCVAWAPNVGRRFHYIASAHGECCVVYKLLRRSCSNNSTTTTTTTTTTSESSTTTLSSSSGLELDSSQRIPVSAWKVGWNVTGTVLAVSGDEGVVNLFKIDAATGTWEVTSTIWNPTTSDNNNNSSQV